MWIKNIHDRSPFSLFIHALFCTMSGNKVMFPISEGNLNFLLCSENLRRDLCWRHCKYKEWVSFFLGSWEMNRSAEQTNGTRAVHAICLFRTAIHFPWTEKKRHSFLKWTQETLTLSAYILNNPRKTLHENIFESNDFSIIIGKEYLVYRAYTASNNIKTRRRFYSKGNGKQKNPKTDT